jgi:hypothetical protein
VAVQDGGDDTAVQNVSRSGSIDVGRLPDAHRLLTVPAAFDMKTVIVQVAASPAVVVVKVVLERRKTTR